MHGHVCAGYFFTYYNTRITEERKAQIERVNEQVGHVPTWCGTCKKMVLKMQKLLVLRACEPDSNSSITFGQRLLDPPDGVPFIFTCSLSQWPPMLWLEHPSLISATTLNSSTKLGVLNVLSASIHVPPMCCMCRCARCMGRCWHVSLRPSQPSRQWCASTARTTAPRTLWSSAGATLRAERGKSTGAHRDLVVRPYPPSARDAATGDMHRLQSKDILKDIQNAMAQQNRRKDSTGDSF